MYQASNLQNKNPKYETRRNHGKFLVQPIYTRLTMGETGLLDIRNPTLTQFLWSLTLAAIDSQVTDDDGDECEVSLAHFTLPVPLSSLGRPAVEAAAK